MQFLSVNSRFIHFLEFVIELVVLNLLTLLCCIPVITAGVALTALYRTLYNIRKGNGDVFADYLEAFKSNFRSGLQLGLFLELICVSFVIYLMYFQEFIVSGDGLVLISVIFLAIFLFFPMTFVFPLHSMFESTPLRTLTNAFFLSFRHFGTSLLVFLMNGLSWILLIINPGWFIRLLPLFVMFAISLPAWIASGMFLDVFKKYSELE